MPLRYCQQSVIDILQLMYALIIIHLVTTIHIFIACVATLSVIHTFTAYTILQYAQNSIV